MSRRETEGNHSGMKQDRFRHSFFEDQGPSERDLHRYESAVSSGNTIGGRWAENRGHRSALDTVQDQGPFEDGGLANWNHRYGWDRYYSQKSVRQGRHGGAILNADEGNHRGRGPKGYTRSDERIREDVCEILFGSRDVNAQDIEVTVKDGCVYLAGEIPSREMKKMAEYEVEAVSGVHDVQNLLRIKKEL